MDMPLWFSNLVFWSLQVALLVLAAGLLVRVLQLRQPRVLLTYWHSLLVICLLLPLMQPWHRPPTITVSAISIDFAVPILPASPIAARWHLPSLQTLAPILGIVILAGIALRFAILGLGLLKLRRLRQASRPIEATAESAAVLQAMHGLLNARAEFRLSSQVDSPVTFGFVAPVVLLPERFTSLELRFQSAIACHELLHVRRRDWAHHLVEELGRALFWFHPAIAWLISRVRLAREQVVDLEVVRLTSARKSYLEALLEFTNARTPLAAIPAPPFLAERQLVERVSLMLKEVRMSQRRLIVSLALISSCLALVIALAAWTFPLKAQSISGGVSGGVAGGIAQGVSSGIADGISKGVSEGVSARVSGTTRTRGTKKGLSREVADKIKQDIPRSISEGISKGIADGVSGGISGSIKQGKPDSGVNGGVADGVMQGVSRGIADGVSKGISEGISSRVSRAVKSRASSDEPNVDVSTIWVDTVKRGSMPVQVRGMGTIVRDEGSANLVARVTVPAPMAANLKPGQYAALSSKSGPIGNGHITGIGPQTNDTRTLDIALDAAAQEITAGLEVGATMTIGKLDNILFVGRPVNGAANSSTDVFKISDDGAEAIRTHVKLGRASVNTIEILDGLKEGDKVILSDMSSVSSAERVRLTDEQHLRSH